MKKGLLYKMKILMSIYCQMQDAHVYMSFDNGMRVLPHVYF